MTLKRRLSRNKRTIKHKKHTKSNKYTRQLGGTTDFTAKVDEFKEIQIDIVRETIKKHILYLKKTASNDINKKFYFNRKKHLSQHKNNILATKLDDFINLLAPLYNFIDRLKANLDKTPGLNNNSRALAKVVIDTINDSNHSMMNYPLLAVSKSITPEQEQSLNIQSNNHPANNKINIKNCVPELYRLLNFYYTCINKPDFTDCPAWETADFNDICPDADDSYLFKHVMQYLTHKQNPVDHNQETEA
jgi:hypothetical protein